MQEMNTGVSEDTSILVDPPPISMGEGSNTRTQTMGRERVPHLLDEQKISLATMNFEGRAALWIQNFNQKYLELSWKQFVEVVSTRFEELKESHIVVEFNKLKHTDNYQDYVDRFEELKNCMQMYGQGAYSENYFLASFISGLSEELRAVITMFNPTNLEQSIELGRNQLITMDALTKKLKTTTRSYGSNWTAQITKPISQSHQPSTTVTPSPSQRALSKEEEFNLLESKGEYTEGSDSISPTEEVLVSLNALNGDDGITTLRFTANPLFIKVANGQRLTSTLQTEDFGWKLQGHTLKHSLRLLQHEGGDSIAQLLVKWEDDENSELVSWEDLKFLQRKFPSFDPCGQGSFFGRSNVVGMKLLAVNKEKTEGCEGDRREEGEEIGCGGDHSG
ncbi:hypothetical protein C2S51_015617 [Perilla frutescens var. frutescens]|nr:hypothetical protein C2S51_015617 [Perilla frutescens var. frutescens]